MNFVEVPECRWHLPQYDIGAAAVHLANVIAFERVNKALGHAIGLRAAYRGADRLDTQVLDQFMRFLCPKSAAIIAQEFQIDTAADFGLSKARLYTLDQHATCRFTRQASARLFKAVMTIAYFRPTGCTSPVLTSTTRTARCGRACWVAWQGSGPQGRPLCLFSGRYA